MSIEQATLRLFKAVPIKDKSARWDKELIKQTIPRGYIFSPEVIYNYTLHGDLMDIVEEIYGITAESLNASFHKSWAKVKDTPQEELMVEQLAHYVTTYGKETPLEYMLEKEENFGVEDLGKKIVELPDFDANKLFEEDYIYIPKEALHIPHWDKENIKLVVIKGYTKEELADKLGTLLLSGIALKEETVKDCVEVAEFVELQEEDIAKIRNKEVKIALYDKLGQVPSNPVEFLRYVVFKSTGQTLLIKNKMLTEKIKEGEAVASFFGKYTTSKGLEELAKIFYRFKPIFLAFKAEPNMKPIINKIRRLAVKHHKPMPEDYLNTVTAKMKKGESLFPATLTSELAKANAFRKIRLAYALKYRMKNVDSILYKIRNGKGYATDFSFPYQFKQKPTEQVLNKVLKSIVEDVSKNVKGKRIYIPDHIHYALPATEKQFTGVFPSGTYVTVPKDIIFGINWKNVDGHQIDLDLSVISPTEGKIGWDSSYKDSGGNILFSGDITDARGQNGATELFYIERQKKEALILYVNYYNYDEKVEVPFKIVVAQEKVSDLKKNYMVDPNNLVAISNSKINQKEKILGLVVTTPDECRFYFTETYMANNITSTTSEVAEHSRKYLFNFYEDSIDLKDILIEAGACIIGDASKKVIDEKEGKVEIDLSVEALEKDTILNLLKK
ncbi:MAG: hypothetical protein V3V81_08010 [Candidatus Bathyarchaeia archaeon]